MKLQSAAVMTAALLALGLFAEAALAQAPPQSLPVSVVGPNASLSVSTSSARVALPGATTPYNAALLINDGSNEAFFARGDSTVAATTSAIPLPPGACIAIWVGDSTYVAAITSASTTTLRIVQFTGQPFYGCTGSSSGGALPVGAATAANQVTGNTSLAALAGSLGATAAGTAPSQGLPALGTYTATQPNLTNGQSASIQLDANGNIYSHPIDGPVVTNTVSTAVTILSFATSGYQTMEAQFATINGTVIFEGTLDQVNGPWVNVNCVYVTPSVTTGNIPFTSTSTVTTSGTVYCPANYPYLRIRQRAISSGTTTANAQMKGTPFFGWGGVLKIQPSNGGALVNGSSTITTGGTSQTILAANASRTYLLVKNACSETTNLYVNFTSAASTSDGNSIELVPCQAFVMEGSYVSPELITGTASNTGHVYQVKSY